MSGMVESIMLGVRLEMTLGPFRLHDRFVSKGALISSILPAELSEQWLPATPDD